MDDNRRFLNGVSALLAQTFDVVGAATNGLQALDAVRLLDPDVIVLDVDMPELDGLQTCRALQQSGSAAPPVVFLSMHDADAIVSAAFQCGGRGYVLKQRVGRDLVHALDQALSGRSFVPSLGSSWPLAGGLHVMQLYDDKATFADGVAALFDLSLRNGEATCIIADREVRDTLAERLRARGWDVGGSSGCRRYLALDARDAVNRFMRGGLPDPDRLAEIAGELDDYRRAVASEGSTSRLTLCGNMVVSLIADGNAKAAMALERHWNRLTRERPILTVCGYSSSCFHDDIPDLWSRACTEHGALSLAADA